jgi:hypothetical protein
MADPAPGNDDCLTYKISVSVSAELDDDESADSFVPYVTNLHIQIRQDWWSDEQQDVVSRSVGDGEGLLLHVANAMNDGADIAEVCDDHSAEAYEYCSAVLSMDSGWREDVNKQFGGELLDNDVLALTKLEIKPEHHADVRRWVWPHSHKTVAVAVQVEGIFRA